MQKAIKFILFFIITSQAFLWAEYPERAITVIVHSKPGGAIDITARTMAKVARKYTKVPVVVENKYGGSGAIAMRTMLNRKADGYTILGFPATFLSALQINNNNISLDDFHFLACMIVAPEVIITNRKSKVVTLEQIIEDAKKKKGRQIWVGPGVGSLDHLMAIKTWEKLGIEATWIPYNGGGQAMAALLGEHGIVYVGNPEDTRGKPDLFIAASATKAPLKAYPKTPTLKKYSLTDEVMWRGFAVKKGVDSKRIQYLENLLRKIHNDSEWKEFVQKNSAESVFLDNKAFTARAKKESVEVVKYLRKAGILVDISKENQKNTWIWIAGIFTFIAACLFSSFRFFQKKMRGDAIIVAIIMATSLLFFCLSFQFQIFNKAEDVNAATVPRLWALVLITLCLTFIIMALREKLAFTPPDGSMWRALRFCFLLISYVVLLHFLGFFASSFLLLISGMYMMGYRKHPWIFATTIICLILMYIGFICILQVPLPKSPWFNL